MNQRRPAAEIMNGLTTKSDKIRALAQAGYDRTEINKVLDIRYQHVRNVLLQSGITGGLRRDAEARARTLKWMPRRRREDTSWTVLTEGVSVHRRMDPGPGVSNQT